jgi:hypothetical protein
MIDVNLFGGQNFYRTAAAMEDLHTITLWYENAGFGRLSDAMLALPENDAK